VCRLGSELLQMNSPRRRRGSNRLFQVCNDAGP